MNSFSNFNVAELKKSFKTSSLEAIFVWLDKNLGKCATMSSVGALSQRSILQEQAHEDGCNFVTAAFLD